MKNKRIVGIVFLFVMILSVSFIAGAASSATFYFDDAPRGYVRAYAGYVSKVGKDEVAYTIGNGGDVLWNLKLFFKISILQCC